MRVLRMAKTEDTKTLEKIGMLFLKSNRCHLVASEVRVWCQKRLNELDNHRVIDLLGVGLKWVPEDKRVPNERGYKSPNIEVLRGIEIKVSENDFKNGFIQSGCNYHYLMFPKGLFTLDQIPKHMGIIEVDIDKFTWSKWGAKYRLRGLETIRSPKFHTVSDLQYNYATREIAKLCSDQMIRWARDQLTEYVHTYEGSME